MRAELILIVIIYAVGAIWLMPSSTMLATANRRFRHLTFHQFTKAAPFPYHPKPRLVMATLGTGAIILLAALPVAACVVGFICFFALFMWDFRWVENEANRIER